MENGEWRIQNGYRIEDGRWKIVRPEGIPVGKDSLGED
jgi:hypothetical protein